MGVRAYKDIVTGTHETKLEQHAYVLECRFGLGLGYQEIHNRTGLGMNTLNNIFNKYTPKQTDRDLVLVIGSRLNNYDDEGDYQLKDSTDYSFYLNT